MRPFASSCALAGDSFPAAASMNLRTSVNEAIVLPPDVGHVPGYPSACPRLPAGDAVIPIRDANPTRRVPWVTLALIATNIVIFLLWQPTFGSDVQQQTFFL